VTVLSFTPLAKVKSTNLKFGGRFISWVVLQEKRIKERMRKIPLTLILIILTLPAKKRNQEMIANLPIAEKIFLKERRNMNIIQSKNI